ncbi:ArsR family transcriptional regulator [Natronococcus jeotgali]|uniref:ArsR family transcriptional regulator n=1 Tax=Natronococcus jeotgali TaxID=413812 RepID=UPI001EF9F2AD|nr:ArsR family transcriptional regulator [Natronococcus jeotgali]
MALSQQPDMDADRLTRTDRAILDTLKAGRGGDDPWGIATKGYLVDETEFSRNSVYQRLEVLEGHGHVRLIHEPTRLFAFVDDPREGGDSND